ncbi:SDR family NAD(P)-dependent oxidoreductase [Bacillus sp. OK048]|uniref:SDR family NAD(P)-dependent oxidoreductase n=1 Tax=Bacillus sp. OK048 TaxID=1882761 RepID=UPI0008821695|nr:SDR family NAD(P)-dependent oxidoreductase [Bacillus sp. OK048]SDL97851.1 3-oxoacyl-[acyl-carrier protein] reductase [Bacillus sp. OK048]
MGILDGKVAIITGAGSGIGREQAAIFSKEGAKVVLADINGENVSKLAEELSPNQKNTLALKVDVLNKEDITNLVDAAIKKFGQIDILCNTAGVFDRYAPILETSEELWDLSMNINVKGLFLMTKAVLPHMINKGKGSIINIASGAGLTGGGGGIAYTSSKHAVVGFTKQIAADYKLKGIRCNSICPGLIETPMVKDVFENPEAINAINKASGRTGKPADIAKASLFLASDLSDYINAVAIPVDGGLLNSISL